MRACSNQRIAHEDTHLTVEEWLQQTLCATGGSAEFALVASHRVKRVDSTFPFLIEPSENVVNIVWEEALAVEDGAEHARDGV